jgi:hypothetical protein
LAKLAGVAHFERLVILLYMTTKEMRSAVMSELAKRGVRKRHKGKTKAQIRQYYKALRTRTPVDNTI